MPRRKKMMTISWEISEVEAEARKRIWGTGAVEKGEAEADRGGEGRIERVGKLIKRARGRKRREEPRCRWAMEPPKTPTRHPITSVGMGCLGRGLGGARIIEIIENFVGYHLAKAHTTL